MAFARSANGMSRLRSKSSTVHGLGGGVAAALSSTNCCNRLTSEDSVSFCFGGFCFFGGFVSFRTLVRVTMSLLRSGLTSTNTSPLTTRKVAAAFSLL